MFKHLLVPLDGSTLAEAALPAAVGLARQAGAAVTLLHVVECHAPETVHGERHLRNAAEAAAYLDDAARRYAADGVRLNTHVHTVECRDVARAIAAHLLELGPDLVVMLRHGHAGLRRRIFGSLAQQVVARGAVPVLLLPPVRAAGAAAPGFPCARILAPDDGAPAHEPSLPVAVALARLCRARLRIVIIVPTRATLAGSQGHAGQCLPRLTEALLDLARQDAFGHVADHVRQWRGEGLDIDAEVIRGDPPRAIVQAARAFAADVVVLGTHGHAGTAAFWTGSTAARVCARAEAAILLVPVKG